MTSAPSPRHGRRAGATAPARVREYLDQCASAESDGTFDALADLFLGEYGIAPPGASAASDAAPLGEARPNRGSPSRSGSEVELLVLGHLPAMASLWGSQYLRDAARQSGRTIASIRLQAGFASVEVFGDAVPVSPDACATLDAAIEAASRASAGSGAPRWVVRADGPEELAFASIAGVGRVTLLTGADEAATIAAYRTIKRLAGALAHEGTEPETMAEAAAHERALPDLHVVVLSASAEQAQRIGAKLVETASAHLGRSVSFTIASPKISAVRPAALLYNGPATLSPGALLDRISASPGASPAPAKLPVAEPANVITARTFESTFMPISPNGGPNTPHNHGIPPAASLRLVETAPARSAAGGGARPIISAPVAQPRMVSFSAPRAPEMRSGTPIGVGTATQAATTPAPQMPELSGDPLASHLPELSGLSMNCPYAAGVQFAVDDAGRMHLLARFEAEIDESSLGVLMIAAEWARAHASILHAAAPALCGKASARLDATLKPMLHVFTSEPRKVRRLLETDVRVHLLSPVRVKGELGWFCTALN